MPNLTPEQYRMHLAKTANSKPPCANPATDESKLQDDIEQYCLSKGWYPIRSRMDRPTTVMPGCPDLIIFADNGRNFQVECKAKNRKQTTEQMAAQAWLNKLGHNYHLVRSFEEFLEVVKC
jgi:hypothetical protein